MFTFFVWDSFKYPESGNLTFLWWTRISPSATECCNCNNVYLPVSFISSRRSFLLATFWVFTQPMPQSLQIQGKSHKASKSHKKLRKALLHGTVFYMDKLFTSLAVFLLAPTGALYAKGFQYRSSKQGRQLFFRSLLRTTPVLSQAPGVTISVSMQIRTMQYYLICNIMHLRANLHLPNVILCFYWANKA